MATPARGVRPERGTHGIINVHESSAPAAPAGQRSHVNGGRRYIEKDGRCTAVLQQGLGRWGYFLLDIFTTLVEIRWRVMFLVFSLSYILSWLIFGLLYWCIAYVHGDTGDPATMPCVQNVRSFTGAFLFSMETQATIGYGSRFMNDNCIVAILVVTVQDVLSCFIDTIIIGIVVAKMASPRKRSQTVGFSSCAVVNLRDAALCLSWRIGDFRGNHILEGAASAHVVRHRRLPSGAVEMSHHELKLQTPDLTLVTPATVVHKLEPGSPLYSLSREELQGGDFELVVTFTYTDDSTGALHQSRSCYTPAEVRWGQRFQDMLREGRSHYHVDYALFHQTSWAQVPTISADAMDRMTSRTDPGPSLNGHGVDVVHAEIHQEAWL